jgi:hypothetical protein
VKQSAWPVSLCAALAVFLVPCGQVLGAQSSQSESGISENNTPDTVHIQNSTRDKSAEPVHVPNSRKSAVRDPNELPNSDETFIDREQVQNPASLTQTPVMSSSRERVKGKGKIITGAALFGVSYGISLFVAANMSSDGSTSDSRNSTYFYIPVVGPAIAGFSLNSSSSDATPVALLFLGWSVAEGMGLALLITGLVGTPAKPDVSALPISLEPLVMKDRAGITLRIRFN